MFASAALEIVQQLRHNSHPQFTFRSAGDKFPNTNDNFHINRFIFTGVQKLNVEALEVTVDEFVTNLLAKQSRSPMKTTVSSMLLHKRSIKLSNPADLLTTIKEATNQLDFRHKKRNWQVPLLPSQRGSLRVN